MEKVDNQSYCYEFPRPSLTVDALVFTFQDFKLKILLIERACEPFSGCWAFPGGFVDEKERVEVAVKRELLEETGLEIDQLSQLFVASAPDRDPRGWTVSVLFIGFVNEFHSTVRGSDDARQALWHPVHNLPELAFDHGKLIPKASQYLIEMAQKSILPVELLSQVFSIEEIESLYFEVLGNRQETQALVGRFIQQQIIIPQSGMAKFQFNIQRVTEIQQKGY